MGAGRWVLTTCILKRSRSKHTVQKQALGTRIQLQSRLTTIRVFPERRNNDDLRAIRNQLPERLGESQVPTD